jgi:antitoxin VapB
MPPGGGMDFWNRRHPSRATGLPVRADRRFLFARTAARRCPGSRQGTRIVKIRRARLCRKRHVETYIGLPMTINVTNREADSLTRQFAKLEGVGLSEAITIAVREAIARRRKNETPLQTAARIRAELGVELTDDARRPLPRSVYDEMSGER